MTTAPRARLLTALIAGCLALGLLAAPGAWGAGLFGPRYTLTDLPAPAPLSRLRLYAPVGDAPAEGLLLLLHGMQDARTPDPTWLAWMRGHAPFDRYVLVVPAVAGARWTDPAVVAALGAVVDQEAARHAVPASRRYIFGFSAGASRGFALLAASPERFAGHAALAGGPGRVPAIAAAALAGERILLMCGSADRGHPCATTEDDGLRLKALGVQDVSTRTLRGVAHECPLDVVAPALRSWIASSP